MLLPDAGNICLHYSIINEKSHLAGEKAGGRSLVVQVGEQEQGAMAWQEMGLMEDKA